MATRALLTLSLLVAACDGGNSNKEAAPATKTPAPTTQEVEARANEVYSAFRAMHDSLPDVAAAATICPDDAIRGWSSGEREKEVTFLAYQSLRHSLGEPWDGNNSVVRFMTNGYLRYQPRAEFDLSKERNVKQLMRLWNFVHYIGIVVPASERKSVALSGSVGKAGAVTGQLVIYRKGETQPLCHAPFSAQGAATVKYSAEVAANSNDKQSKAAYALKKDLCYDIAKAVKAAIGSISHVLEPSRIDCNSV